MRECLHLRPRGGHRGQSLVGDLHVGVIARDSNDLIGRHRTWPNDDLHASHPRDAQGSAVSAARRSKTTHAVRVSGPGAAGSATPSMCAIGITSRVVDVMNASLVSRSVSIGSATSPTGAPSSASHSMTSSRVTPARQPADNGGVTSSPLYA